MYVFIFYNDMHFSITFHFDFIKKTFHSHEAAILAGPSIYTAAYSPRANKPYLQL